MKGKGIATALAGLVLGGAAGFGGCYFGLKRVRFKMKSVRMGEHEIGYEINACSPLEMKSGVFKAIADQLAERSIEKRRDTLKGEQLFVEDLTQMLKSYNVFGSAEGAHGDFKMWVPFSKQMLKVDVEVLKTGVESPE